MQPALFLRQFPKQEVCCEVSLKKQAVTTGLSPGAGHGADGEPLRRGSCKYEFCYSPAFQCGFISKAGVFLASLSLPVAQIHQRLSAPNFLLLSGGTWEPTWSLAVRLNLSYKYQNLSQNPIVRGDAVLCRQSPWRGIAVALAAVAGRTCAPGPPTPLGSMQGRGQILFILLDLGIIPWCLRGFGHLSWAAWTRGRWQVLSPVGRARRKTQSVWMAAAWGSSHVKGAGSWILRVCVSSQPLFPAVVCLHSPISLPLCAARWERGSNSPCCSASHVSVPDKRPPETEDKFSLGAGSAFSSIILLYLLFSVMAITVRCLWVRTGVFQAEAAFLSVGRRLSNCEPSIICTGNYAT